MRVVIACADLMSRSRIESAARAAGHEVVSVNSVPAPAEPFELLVADLDEPGAIERIELLRAARPDASISGFAFHVNKETIFRAKAAGVRVQPHGADPATLLA